MQLLISTIEKTLFAGLVQKVGLPGKQGSFEVLSSHIPLVSTLDPGKIIYHTASGRTDLPVQGGIVIIKDNVITICLQKHLA